MQSKGTLYYFFVSNGTNYLDTSNDICGNVDTVPMLGNEMSEKHQETHGLCENVVS